MNDFLFPAFFFHSDLLPTLRQRDFPGIYYTNKQL